MSRFAVFAFTLICLAGFWSSASAQGPVRNAVRELRLQRADYPGPIAYSPSDQNDRSRRLRLQTGHYGFFYNCDDEECKRNSPYINWSSQHQPDCRNGWRNALRMDRRDVIQRILDGSCADEGCEQCDVAPRGFTTPQVMPHYLGRRAKATHPQNPAPRVSQRTANPRLPVINASSLDRR